MPTLPCFFFLPLQVHLVRPLTMPPLPGSDDKAEEFDLLPTAPRQNYSRLGWVVPLTTMNSACATFTIATSIVVCAAQPVVQVLVAMSSACATEYD